MEILAAQQGQSQRIAREPINSLIWMRALAIIFIIVIHVVDFYAQDRQFSRRWFLILGIEALTRPGLILFFLMSGFLLIKPYIGNRAMRNFYKTRLARILPLFIGWSLIYFIYTEHSLNLFIFAKELVQDPIFYHLWYIYTLLGIYLTTPFLANILVQANYATLGKFIILSICAYTFVPLLKYLNIDSSLYGYFAPFWLVYFISGYLLKCWLEQPASKKTRLAVIYVFCTFGVYLLSFFKEDFAHPAYFIYDPRPYDSNIFIYGASLCLFCMIYKYLAFAPPGLIKFTAARSYGIYLSHALFLDIFRQHVPTQVWWVNLIMTFIFVLVCCLLLEYGLQKLTEGICKKLKLLWRLN